MFKSWANCSCWGMVMSLIGTYTLVFRFTFWDSHNTQTILLTFSQKLYTILYQNSCEFSCLGHVYACLSAWRVGVVPSLGCLGSPQDMELQTRLLFEDAELRKATWMLWLLWSSKEFQNSRSLDVDIEMYGFWIIWIIWIISVWCVFLLQLQYQEDMYDWLMMVFRRCNG